jgi:integrase
MHEMVERYALTRDITYGSAEQLDFAVRSFGKFLKRQPTSEDFQDDTINRFILWLISEGFAHETVRSRRRALLTLWRADADDGLVPPPRKVRRLRPKCVLPRAWTPEQLDAILAQCDKLRGRFRTNRAVERRAFARAYVLTAYESGLRRSDLLRIRRRQIQASGLIVIVQSKTGQVHLSRIRPETIAAIDAMGTAGRETVFGGMVSNRRLCRMFTAIFRAAGMPEGSMKWLRRSGATHVEMKNPGAGWRFLGHTSDRIAKVSYIDPTQVGAKPFIPPRIGDRSKPRRQA